MLMFGGGGQGGGGLQKTFIWIVNILLENLIVALYAISLTV